VDAALGRLAAAGVGARRIPVACAFHSPIVAGARERLAAWLERVAVAAPRHPVWSNTTATPYPADAAAIRARIAEHVAEPVRFADEVEGMYAAGARIFVEAGPGRVLSGLVDRILGDRPHLTGACEDPGARRLRPLQLP